MKELKKLTIKNSYGKEINVTGKKLGLEETREVEETQEIKNLIKRGYVIEVQKDPSQETV